MENEKLKKTKLFASTPSPFVMELPPYHLPVLGNILRVTLERGVSFFKKATTIILLSSIVLFSMNKLKLDKKKIEEIEAVKKNTNTARMLAAQIQELLDEVVALRDNLRQQYNGCLTYFGEDFTVIPREQQMQLGVLVNNTKSLAASLRKSIQ